MSCFVFSCFCIQTSFIFLCFVNLYCRCKRQRLHCRNQELLREGGARALAWLRFDCTR